MGASLRSIIQKSEKPSDEWLELASLGRQGGKSDFFTVAQSMEALPGVEDLSRLRNGFGKKVVCNSQSNEEVRKQREWEWEREQKVNRPLFEEI